MGELLRTIMVSGTSTFVMYKALKCFGKQDYADIIALTGWCAVGISAIKLSIEAYEAFMGSRLVKLLEAIVK